MCIGRPGGPKHSSFWQRGWGAPDGVQVGHSVCWFSVPPCAAPHGRLSDPRVGRTHENTISAMSPACSHAKGWHQLQRPPGCLRRATHLALAPEPCSLGTSSLSSCSDTARLPRGAHSGLPAPVFPRVLAQLPQRQLARAGGFPGSGDGSDRE